MRLGITGRLKNVLGRSAAVFVLGITAAGCSSGVMSLDDGLVTNSTTSNSNQAPAYQPFPNDNVMRPKVAVGGGSQPNAGFGQQTAPSQSFPAPSYPTAAAGTSNITSQPLAAPQPSNSQAVASDPQPVSGPMAQQPQQPAPQPANRQEEQVAVLPQVPKVRNGGKAEPERSTAGAVVSDGAYKVASGDTLYGISQRTGVSVDAIRQANGMPSSSVIRIGQKLVIPSQTATKGPQEQAVAAVSATNADDSAASASSTTASRDAEGAVSTSPSQTASQTKEEDLPTYTPPAKEENATSAEKDSTELAALTPDSTGVGRLRWPVNGRVVSKFGSGGGSDGIDIAVPEGTPIRAAENGIVIYSGDGLKGFGNTLLVRHESGLVTVYGHASELKVKRGETVQRGQQIALAGATGDTDRPQLHFEVRKGTNPVDPMEYLE